MNRKLELLEAIKEVANQLEEAKQKLASVPCPKISNEDIEDISDTYQERLEYNWWVEEQKSEISKMETGLEILTNELESL